MNAATSTSKRVKVAALSPTDRALATVPTPCRVEYCSAEGGRRAMSRFDIIRSWRTISLNVTSMSSQYSLERESGRSRNEVPTVPVGMARMQLLASARENTTNFVPATVSNTNLWRFFAQYYVRRLISGRARRALLEIAD